MEIDNFDVLWLKITIRNKTRSICSLYRSPTDDRYHQLFQYLSEKVDWIQANCPSSEVIILGDFNVHNSDWLVHSNRTDEVGRRAEAFAISCNLSQMVDCPTRVPSNPSDFQNLLDLYLTSEPVKYKMKAHAPLGNSDHI